MSFIETIILYRWHFERYRSPSCNFYAAQALMAIREKETKRSRAGLDVISVGWLLYMAYRNY